MDHLESDPLPGVALFRLVDAAHSSAAETVQQAVVAQLLGQGREAGVRVAIRQNCGCRPAGVGCRYRDCFCAIGGRRRSDLLTRGRCFAGLGLVGKRISALTETLVALGYQVFVAGKAFLVFGQRTDLSPLSVPEIALQEGIDNLFFTVSDLVRHGLTSGLFLKARVTGRLAQNRRQSIPNCR